MAGGMLGCAESQNTLGSPQVLHPSHCGFPGSSSHSGGCVFSSRVITSHLSHFIKLKPLKKCLDKVSHAAAHNRQYSSCLLQAAATAAKADGLHTEETQLTLHPAREHPRPINRLKQSQILSRTWLNHDSSLPLLIQRLNKLIYLFKLWETEHELSETLVIAVFSQHCSTRCFSEVPTFSCVGKSH